MDQSGCSGRQCASGILCGWGGDLALFPPPAPLHFTVLHFLYIPHSPIPLLFFGLLFNYSYVPLIPCHLKLLSTQGFV